MKRVRTLRAHRAISDRRKVLFLAVALTMLTIAVVAYATINTTRSRMLARIDASLQSQLSNARVANDLLTPQTLASMVKLNSVLSRESAVMVADAHGRVLSSLPAALNGKTDTTPRFSPAVLRHPYGRPFKARSSKGDDYRVITGPLNGNTLLFATPLAAINQTVRDLTQTTIIVGMIATFAFALLLWLILSAATRPFDSMIDVATKIGGGDFSARIEPDDLPGDAKRLGSALNQMVTRLEEAFAARQTSEERLRRFVADASHELRTPLTNIHGYAQLCRMGATGDEPALAVERIESEARRMSLLVEDLLLLARLDQGRRGPRAAVDVGELVSEVVDDARMIEPARPSSFDLPSERLRVLGNAGELRQVFANLLANVRDHTDSTTPTSVSIASDADRVIIEVSDTGPGMSELDAQNAFDRFYRSDSSRSRQSGGTGLGLAIANEIVESHRGTIELRTRLGEGTMVRVTLPLHDVSSGAPSPVSQ